MNLSDSELPQALQSLLPRERKVIELHAAGWTLDRIGERFKFSYSQAYQVLVVARAKLKSRLKVSARAGKH
jgi:DNA-directed RNA polymerase specialized sigma24 family protein